MSMKRRILFTFYLTDSLKNKTFKSTKMFHYIYVHIVTTKKYLHIILFSNVAVFFYQVLHFIFIISNFDHMEAALNDT